VKSRCLSNNNCRGIQNARLGRVLPCSSQSIQFSNGSDLAVGRVSNIGYLANPTTNSWRICISRQHRRLWSALHPWILIGVQTSCAAAGAML
jgi:hypothetical protein